MTRREREIHKEWCKHINVSSTHDEAIQTFARAIERQALERAEQMCVENASRLSGLSTSNAATALIITSEQIRALIEGASSDKEKQA